MPKEICDIGLIGLAVMGQNLALNMNDHGYRVAVFNRTLSKVDDFVQGRGADGKVARVRISPEGSRVANPAFDVTPNRYVTAIVTERGVARAPFLDSLSKLVK